MNIRIRFIIYFLIIFLVVLSMGIFSVLTNIYISRYLEGQLPAAISDINHAARLSITAQLIRYDDEVLTQAARNYAFTGEKKWKDRYNEFIPKLDLRISQALSGADERENKIFSSINDANLALVDLETQALNYVDAGDLTKAQEILDSEKYWEQKEVYKAGIDEYVSVRGVDLDSATSVSTQALESAQYNMVRVSRLKSYIIYFFIVFFILALFFLLEMITRSIIRPIKILQQATTDIAQGDLTTKVDIENKDEVGALANNFNRMAESLKESMTNVEGVVRQRTAELEKINSLMVGRELKMIELKKELTALKNKKNESYG